MQPADVEIAVVHGEVPDTSKQRARDKIARLERVAPKRILFARVRFDRPQTRQRPDPPVHVQAQLDLEGQIVQTSTVADQPDEAVDILENRLREQLRRLASRLNTIRHEPETVSEGEWRRGALPTDRPDHFPRPCEERQTIWRESFARNAMRPDEAAFDLDMLDYEFHLFVELETGADAVVYHLPEQDGTVFGLSLTGDAEPSLQGQAVPLRLDPPAAPLTLDAALERLDAGEERFVFFVQERSGRGAVAHHRYDGHYGVVVPHGTLDAQQGVTRA